jgi:hypothetical protein
MNKYNFTMPTIKSNITETIFFKNLEHISGEIGKSPTYYLLNCPNGLNDFLNNISSNGIIPIQLDCAIYVQLVCYYDSNPNLDKYIFIIGAPINALSIYFPIENTIMCYLRPSNYSAFDYLQQSSCNSKGQFLIKTSDNTYYGLGSNGPINQTLNEWISDLKNDCLTWLKMAPKSNYEKSLKSIINCLLLSGKLDEWHIEKDIYNSNHPKISD